MCVSPQKGNLIAVVELVKAQVNDVSKGGSSNKCAAKANSTIKLMKNERTIRTWTICTAVR